MLAPPPREVTRIELMDRLDARPDEMARNLADIARLNRLGATQTILRHVAALVAREPPGKPLRMLDLGTGAADIPLALARWGRSEGRRLRIVALEIHPTILRYATQAVDGVPEVRIVAGDALDPPLRPGSIDIALCSLMLHHLPEPAVVDLLRRMAQVSRLGFVVSDFRRDWLAWAAVWLVTRAIAGNRMTRHDGPLSVRRAYTPAELARLAARAGLPDIRWHRGPSFRQIGVWVRPPTGAPHAA
ncbi:MAG TPA: methyltransferase domain-containing protein [Methylomirabilota bacterium]|jgi:ubiquinone/menaquinone biosynthesis C-methylase UbiE